MMLFKRLENENAWREYPGTSTFFRLAHKRMSENRYYIDLGLNVKLTGAEWVERRNVQ